MTKKISRRKFLVRGGLSTLGVLAIGTYAFRNPLRRKVLGMVETLPPTYVGSGTEPNLWFELTAKNTLIFHSPKVEMGQGAFTGFAQMIADEMDLRIDQIEVIGAATKTGIVDALATGGSLSVSSLWTPLRELSATMREMLKIEAAKKLNTDIALLTTKEGQISNGKETIAYAAIANGITEWEIPDTPDLKPVKNYKFIGKPIKRIDLNAKVFGDPIFGLDATMPEMLYASIIRPSVVGATFKKANFSAAKSMSGVVQIVQIDDWVGIIAKSYPQVLAAKRTIEIDWNIEKLWTEEELREMLKVGKGKQMITQKEGNALDINDKDTTSIQFTSPLGAHAQIEPNAAVANYNHGNITVILSTQVPGLTQNAVAKALDVNKENVNIIPTYLGGGFGRRLNTNHAIQTVQLSKVVGKPVKYIFSRKEEFQNDLFRPPTHHIVKGKLNKEGFLDTLEHHYASGDVSVNSIMMPKIATTVLGTDIGAMRGAHIMYDKIPNYRAVQWHQTLPFATSWWRSLGLLANTFAIESFIDEMAIKANKNPIHFRLASIDNKGNQKRLYNVITLASEKGNYNDNITNGKAMGFAASIDTNSPAAHVVEVSIENNQIKVHKVTCAFDCGVIVNPDQVKAQCEGAIIMGMSAAMFEKMTLKDGALHPTIYGPYDMALIKHAPKEIDIHFIQGKDIPLPVGEPPMGPIGAAIANAVRRLTGKRLTNLPLQLHE
ncbi:xanthine dehydrogenase family protein molybdopterin-binding subunit [Polaribacter sp. WD7]|uniref:xanthine dehydrogenase family protein molybdopterin-binding subunit n=1 Tax=Polaribacter sp. WD7 TaxID=2269061 RepID=UPI000DF18C40|nr:molybdopterin cofactor-binding domain-containing protein [Polaribacter sp. WD7]RCS26343.1 xanthine dehydrogenase family protein molybdopterin-binding subunit [Polaribacter sp. WD7]